MISRIPTYLEVTKSFLEDYTNVCEEIIYISNMTLQNDAAHGTFTIINCDHTWRAAVHGGHYVTGIDPEAGIDWGFM